MGHGYAEGEGILYANGAVTQLENEGNDVRACGQGRRACLNVVSSGIRATRRDHGVFGGRAGVCRPHHGRGIIVEIISVLGNSDAISRPTSETYVLTRSDRDASRHVRAVHRGGVNVRVDQGSAALDVAKRNLVNGLDRAVCKLGGEGQGVVAR